MFSYRYLKTRLSSEVPVHDLTLFPGLATVGRLVRDPVLLFTHQDADARLRHHHFFRQCLNEITARRTGTLLH
jgi:hypothetical protein